MRLKSGGPAMTVADIEGDAVYAAWWTGEKFAEEEMVLDCLVRVSADA